MSWSWEEATSPWKRGLQQWLQLHRLASISQWLYWMLQVMPGSDAACYGGRAGCGAFFSAITAAWEPLSQPGPVWSCMEAASSCLRYLLSAVPSCPLGLCYPLKFSIALVPQEGWEKAVYPWYLLPRPSGSRFTWSSCLHLMQQFLTFLTL